MDLRNLQSNSILILPYPLNNFEVRKYYQSEPRFIGVYIRGNLPNKILNGVYVINLNEYYDIGTH